MCVQGCVGCEECVWTVTVVGTHMFEGVVGHRQGSVLLQIVVPVKV